MVVTGELVITGASFTGATFTKTVIVSCYLIIGNLDAERIFTIVVCVRTVGDGGYCQYH